MHESLYMLHAAYSAMVDRVRHQYDPQFAELWRTVARDVRRQTVGKGSLPRPIGQVLNDHQAAFAKLRRGVVDLYAIDERCEGLLRVNCLRIEHINIEESLLWALVAAADLTDEQQVRLEADAEQRQQQQDRLRREVRLIIDQGLFCLADAIMKATAGRDGPLEEMVGYGMDYMSRVFPTTSMSQG